MKKTPQLIEVRCVEINCPHWGWLKVKFEDLDFNWWDVPGCDSGLEVFINCPCGEEHEIKRY